MARPKFWLESAQIVDGKITWTQNDTTTNLVGKICRSEDLSLKRNLDGLVVRCIVTPNGDLTGERINKEVVNHNQTVNRGEFHVKMDLAAVDTIGEFKIEFRLWDDGSPIGVTHHEDFVVI